MKKNLLDKIDVKNPCSESWDEMSGNDQIRFCSHCSKDVYDLSTITRVKAEKLVRESNGRLCVKYIKDDRGKVITAPPRLTQIRRQVTVAASVLAASLTFSTLSYAQGAPTQSGNKVSHDKKAALRGDSTTYSPFLVSGVVQDPNGAVVPGAHVTLHFVKTQWTTSTRTDAEGRFSFANIETGVYEIEIEVPGFKRHVFANLNVDKDIKLEEPLILDPSDVVVELMGVVGFAEGISEEVSSDTPPVTGVIRPLPAVSLPPAKMTDRKRKKNKLPK